MYLDYHKITKIILLGINIYFVYIYLFLLVYSLTVIAFKMFLRPHITLYMPIGIWFCSKTLEIDLHMR